MVLIVSHLLIFKLEPFVFYLLNNSPLCQVETIKRDN